MSILPTSGVIVSAAGAPLAQTGGADRARAQAAATVQQRQDESEIRAEDTAGIAATDSEDQQANDRDADGRRPWEFPARHAPVDEVDLAAESAAQAAADGDTESAADDSPDSQADGDHIDLTG